MQKNLGFLEPYIKEDVGSAGGMVWILLEPGMLNIAFKDVTVLCGNLNIRNPLPGLVLATTVPFLLSFPTQGLKHLCISAKTSPP